MTAIGSINGIAGAAPLGVGAPDARAAATGAIGEIGHRVLAWVGASGGGGDRAGWTASTGAASEFQPDSRELARGGDVYALGELGSGITEQFGGTPTQQGELGRALEGFTRAAVVQLAGLAGAQPDRQLAGVREAVATADRLSGAGGIDGVIQRLDAATAVLARQNGD